MTGEAPAPTTADTPAAGQAPRCAADYHDGRSARAQPVQLWLAGSDLQVAGDGVALRVPRRALRWPERQRHGPRQLLLPDGGVLLAHDAAAWDRWAAASGLREGWVVRAQQSWPLAAGAALAVVALLAAGWRWGLPATADALAAAMPPAVDAALGEAALRSLEPGALKASTLPAARRDALQAQLQGALAAAARGGPDAPPPWQLLLRDGTLGANAFALPGGTIVVTDEAARRMADRPEAMLAVLGHELGHLRHRHGTRLLARALLLGAASSALWGDSSALFAALPTVLGQAAYSRDFEREADRDAARWLRAAGHDPAAAMGAALERLRAPASPGGSEAPRFPLPIAFASHPPDAERLRAMAAVKD